MTYVQEEGTEEETSRVSACVKDVHPEPFEGVPYLCFVDGKRKRKRKADGRKSNFKDVVKVTSSNSGKDRETALKEELNRKYTNKVCHGHL